MSASAREEQTATDEPARTKRQGATEHCWAATTPDARPATPHEAGQADA